jgi:hypothetical protein
MVDGAVFSALLILLRLVWVFPGAGVSWLVRTRLAHQDEKLVLAHPAFAYGRHAERERKALGNESGDPMLGAGAPTGANGSDLRAGLNGVQTVEALHKLRPGLPVLHFLVYSEEEGLRPRFARGVPYIAKPFTSFQLTQKIREVLDAGNLMPLRRRRRCANPLPLILACPAPGRTVGNSVAKLLRANYVSV